MFNVVVNTCDFVSVSEHIIYTVLSTQIVFHRPTTRYLRSPNTSAASAHFSREPPCQTGLFRRAFQQATTSRPPPLSSARFSISTLEQILKEKDKKRWIWSSLVPDRTSLLKDNRQPQRPDGKF
ncbi:hypothetical protein VNO78_23555 [Psophocarpus tetragonolobus]|uniref:Uncharacterized protein n=1 Tax=Psophocarpus tetragonolobus TaxID=3891 RepID=A0AAN9S6X9_PSOTE